MGKRLLWYLFAVSSIWQASAQPALVRIGFDNKKPFHADRVVLSTGDVPLPQPQPFFSLLIDSLPVTTATKSKFVRDTLFFTLADSIYCWAAITKDSSRGVRYKVRFLNGGKTEHRLENLVPLGEGTDRVYITAGGSKEWPGYLCRSRLYRPGYGPVGVVLPDNAWHLGFTDLRINDSLSVVALARRGARDQDKAMADRWKVTLKPGGWTDYSIWFDVHAGGWHHGLKIMFRDRWLYDLFTFNDTLYRRSDLAWMKHTYTMLLQFAWDKKYYDWEKQQYTFYQSLHEYDSLMGGFDIFTLWPTWPRLGLDQRNQFDMYRYLPGWYRETRQQVRYAHSLGKRYFLSYNPWDEGTNREDHMQGMGELLSATDADGMVLDTRGSSSWELQTAADNVRPGIIMYSEGMAVPKDMPGIVAGRVHDALVLPPPLNMNKFIKPDFAIFRVLQLADDRLHRELGIAFFNGYGVEINTMRPGRPDWISEEFAYLGRTTRILRENREVFTDGSFYPLIPAVADSVWVNGWSHAGKGLFTNSGSPS